MSRYLKALETRVLVYDGAMGTMLQGQNLAADDFRGKEGCNEYLVLTRPDAVSAVHQAYLDAGCDVLETDTFGGNRLKLAEYGLETQLYEINFQATRLARQAADSLATAERPRFVAGSIGPTGMLPSSDDPALGALGFEELAAIFEEQAAPLVEGGADVLLIETSQDILEVKAAIAGIRRYFRRSGRQVPIQAQVTLDVSGRMLLGTDMGAAIAILEALRVDAVGLNCSTGPELMRGPLELLSERASCPLAVIPNAGLPLNVGGKAVYPLEPEPMALALREFVERYGVAIVGGCCGTTPAHIQAIARAVADLVPSTRPRQTGGYVASAFRAVRLAQEPAPLLVGERVNAQGSRKVKELLLQDDYDGILQVGRDQVEGGAHVLDVCVALTERGDEAEQMRRVVKALSMGVEAPLMLDSTEPAVLLAALRAYPGRAIVNSVHLESGRARMEAVLPHAIEHGAAVVALTIDEAGMARTAERKLEVARRIHQLATQEFGLDGHALIFDALTFTLATGEAEFRDSARETLEGLRLIKEALPGVHTVLGVSNLSFGLAPRARGVLNSVFLDHAVRAGLDMAIVNPAQVVPLTEIAPEARERAEDLIFNRHPEALQNLIAYFEAQADPVAGPAEDPTEAMEPEARIHHQILHRRREGIEELIDRVLERRDPVDVLNHVLLPAMKDVGDQFGRGELILPFVLQSAEVMKRAVAYLEQFLERTEGYTKGKVVLATVYGDVHDIGKNLVNTLLTNNGYTVIDLGKQVPVHTIVEKAVEVGADAIGLSALLVSTSKQMPLCVEALHERGLAIPVIVGGAAINRSFGRRLALLPGGAPYEGGAFYANDAFEGLALMDQLAGAGTRAALIERIQSEALSASVKVARVEAPSLMRSATRTDVAIPVPPFWGHRLSRDVPLDRAFECLDLKSLFRLSWGARATHGEAWDRLLKEDFEPRLQALKAQARAEGFLAPAFLYGYFPCQADGERLLIYAGPDSREVVAHFDFPRQAEGDRLCLADYFAPLESGRMDVVALQAVTVGPRASERVQRLQDRGDYSAGYYLHGLAVETAEAMAEVAHRHIRSELGLGAGQGKRYSWGYPAIPELADHRKVFDLLPVSRELGLDLTEACQLVPEQSTMAIVVHHPDARYYAVRAAASSIEQEVG